jgi:phosphoribosylaminoimidazolecarboxamide formyltransferase/IMP cyclohydrolase
LLSVTDKAGLVDFARGLEGRGFRILSSGGTARALRDGGLEVTEVAEYTGSPEILGGRVKTLHPKIHAGILARPGHAGDDADLADLGFEAIDLVAVNLYRFEEAVERFRAEGPAASCPDPGDPRLQEVLEEIDIGGPTLIRAAAKNPGRVTVVVDPSDYPRVLEAMDDAGQVPPALRGELAGRAFRLIAAYDRAIDEFFTLTFGSGRRTTDLPPGAGRLLEGDLPAALESVVAPESSAENRLRYGENPHQRGLFLRGREPGEASVLHARLLGGKALSYNNLVDAEGALELVKEFAEPAAVVIKHANPCGAAVAGTPAEAFARALAGDPLSAFGGILAFNRPVDVELARRIAVRENFFEVLVAPGVAPEALEALTAGAPWGRNLRVLACGDTGVTGERRPRWTLRPMVGGVLVQERDLAETYRPECVTRRAPTAAEEADLRLAWKIVKHVHSNAIVFVKDGQLVGTGAGQMSRVDSVELAARKAGDRARGAIMASDAFFPFRDGIDAAARAGIRAVIQPGGSRRDAEVIAACDEQDLAMVTTGARHFLH